MKTKRAKKTEEQKMLDRIDRYWNGKGRSFYLNGDHFPIKVFKYGYSTPNWTFNTYDEFKAFWAKGEHEYHSYKHYPNEFQVIVDFLDYVVPLMGKEEDIVRRFDELPAHVSYSNGSRLEYIMDADLKGEKVFIYGGSFTKRPKSFHLESNVTEKVLDAIARWEERHNKYAQDWEEKVGAMFV